MRTDAPTPLDALGALKAATRYPEPTFHDFSSLQSVCFAHTAGGGALEGPAGAVLPGAPELPGPLAVGTEADGTDEPLGKSRLVPVDGADVTPTFPDPPTVDEQPAATSSSVSAAAPRLIDPVIRPIFAHRRGLRHDRHAACEAGGRPSFDTVVEEMQTAWPTTSAGGTSRGIDTCSTAGRTAGSTTRS